MRILVLGGAGYIGSHTVYDLETIISTAWNWHINHPKDNKLMPD